MANRSSGCGFKLVVLALLVVLGFNFWQTYRLRKEVETLRTEVSALKAARGIEPAGPTRTLSLILKARKHADEARRHILDGEFNKARGELDKSLRLMQQAGQDAAGPSAQALDKLQQTLKDTQGSIERMWQNLNKKSEKDKGG